MGDMADMVNDDSPDPMQVRDSMAAPFVKYAGGKRQLLPELFKSMAAFRSHGHYSEPFRGGGALVLAAPAKGFIGAATLNDSNERLIRTYMGVRDEVDEVIALLRKHKYNKREFLAERARRIDLCSNDFEVAAWFIYLNRTGYNGLYRVNRAGQFNVPFGRHTNSTICDELGLRAASKALHATMLKSGDFEKAIKGAETGNLVYFDPPYIPASATADFTSYTKDGFSLGDQERLRDVAAKLKGRGVNVILSNADVPLVRKLYAPRFGFSVRRVEARRNVNSKAGKRGPVGEVIIT